MIPTESASESGRSVNSNTNNPWDRRGRGSTTPAQPGPSPPPQSTTRPVTRSITPPTGFYQPGQTTVSPGPEANVWARPANAQMTGPLPSVWPPPPLQPTYTGTNPFLRQQRSQPILRAPFQASAIPQLPQLPQSPPPPQLALPPLPPSTHQLFSHLTLAEPSNNPWQPALDRAQAQAHSQQQPQQQPDQQVQRQHQHQRHTSQPLLPRRGTGRDTQSAPPPAPTGQEPSSTRARSSALIDLASDDGLSPEWEEVWRPSEPTTTRPSADLSGIFQETSHAWEHVTGAAQATGQPTPVTSSGQKAQPGSGHLFPHPPETTTATTATVATTPIPPSSRHLPPLPPPSGQRTDPISPFVARATEDDLKQTYQIKKISWVDPKSQENPRTSPILMQNANGPCPLVALVNGLVLTAPDYNRSDMCSPLVQVLRTKEQVTLKLLLDAVFEELMSQQRTGPGSDLLPDLSQLYEFLKGLHTGMNVNPHFLPTETAVRAIKRTSLSHLHPSERADLIPGTFEPTTEMRLYATFAIPLIHGWLPTRADPAYAVLERRARSYEDAQTLLSQEDELERKLEGGRGRFGDGDGLTDEEQQTFQDMLTVKAFITTTATQLTPWGLEVVARSIEPGSVAILFRNDHFSTLYRHPQTLQLLSLVTDAGYASHDEIVWESLVDTTGEGAEFFSGDFRVVGGALATHPDRTMPMAAAQPDLLMVPGPDDTNWPALGGGGAGAEGGSSSGGGGGPRRHAETDGVWRTRSGSGGGGDGGGGGGGGHGGGEGEGGGAGPAGSGPVSAREQEDRDLALALQLQEEEDARELEEQARRDRESRLSEQFIEQQARQGPSADISASNRATTAATHDTGGGPTPVGRRHGDSSRALTGQAQAQAQAQTQTHAQPLPAVRASSSSLQSGASSDLATSNQPAPTQPAPRLSVPLTYRPGDETEEAPPPYEYAAKLKPYDPPPGHPSHPASSPTAQKQTRQSGANGRVSGGGGGGSGSGGGSGGGGGVGGGGSGSASGSASGSGAIGGSARVSRQSLGSATSERSSLNGIRSGSVTGNLSNYVVGTQGGGSMRSPMRAPIPPQSQTQGTRHHQQLQQQLQQQQQQQLRYYSGRVDRDEREEKCTVM